MKCRIINGELVIFPQLDGSLEDSLEFICKFYSKIVKQYSQKHKGFEMDLKQECYIAITNKFNTDLKYLTVKNKVYKMLSGTIKNYIRKNRLNSNMLGSRNNVRKYSILSNKYRNKTITDSEIMELNRLEKEVIKIGDGGLNEACMYVEYFDPELKLFSYKDILNKLNTEEDIFIMEKFYIDDYTDLEISKILNKSKHAIKKKRQRLLDSLRERITTREFV